METFRLECNDKKIFYIVISKKINFSFFFILNLLFFKLVKKLILVIFYILNLLFFKLINILFIFKYIYIYYNHFCTAEKLANVLAFNLLSSSLSNSISSVCLLARSNNFLLVAIY